MKNSKLLILALLISLTATAQVKTGGGPDNTDLYDQNKIMVDKSLEDLMAAIKENDVKCSSTPRLKFETNIVQVYVKLAVLENLEKSKTSSTECEEAHRYLACINDKTTMKHARDILVIPASSQHIGDIYNINGTEARKIIKYFGYPEKKKK